MIPFINQVLQEVNARGKNLSEYTFVLPSKRAGAYLIRQLPSLLTESTFAPEVFSIEEFIEEVAGLKSVDNLTALFEFYSAYSHLNSNDEIESFDNFASWGQTLFHDFNEIDRYLLDYREFFGNLASIQNVKHWSLEEEQTNLMKRYLLFWNSLPGLYERFQNQLEKKGLAYQGMVYRKALSKISTFCEDNPGFFIFLGFNALNQAEQKILQYMLEKGVAEVFWDLDEYFYQDPNHSVSYFIRQYLEKWPYYQKKPYNFFSSDFSSEKEINRIGVPRNIGQAKYVGEILGGLPPEELKKTAVVLGDESLLVPVLNSLPATVADVNVTMGLSLKQGPASVLIENLLKMHASGSERWYYKEILAITNHPLIKKVTGDGSEVISEKIQGENLVYLSSKELLNLIPEVDVRLYQLCFGNWENNPSHALDKLQDLLFLIKENLNSQNDAITGEFLYQLHLLFNKIRQLTKDYDHIKSVKTLFSIYRDLLATQSVDLQGTPFSGVQIMGVLESRVLDFEHVIVLSVNEGTLPSGKSSNSFIPFDLKCHYQLPTYKEKDAIYAYHFYHLLQRARNIHLLYNTESNGLNAGEKSRFLVQLELEPLQNHLQNFYSVIPKVPSIPRKLKSITKTPAVMERLKELAGNGFSPSALTSYIRNPIDFYKQYILKIKDPQEVEEVIGYNTLGTVVHNSLEFFYLQWVNQELQISQLDEAIKKAPAVVSQEFASQYGRTGLSTGKNLLISEVANRYVSNFLKMERSLLRKGNEVRILHVEKKLSSSFSIAGLDFPIRLKGTVDRVDQINGITRVIDYKTGKVEQSKVEVVNWEDLTTDYDKFSKSFQVLMYAYLLSEETGTIGSVEAGIISFKNLRKGFLKFTKKDKPGKNAEKVTAVSTETLEAFRRQLEHLIKEICDPDINFEEKEIGAKQW